MSTTPFDLLPPLLAGEGWGGVALAAVALAARALPPPNLPLLAGGGTKAATASTRPSSTPSGHLLPGGEKGLCP
jgi:hypothetical protein